jgi:hypothetical protein
MLAKLTQAGLPQGMMFGGMYSLHRFEDPRTEATAAMDTLKAMWDLQLATKLGHTALGKGFGKFRAQMEARTEEFLRSAKTQDPAKWSLAFAHGVSQVPAHSAETPLEIKKLTGPSAVLMSKSGEGSGLITQSGGKAPAIPIKVTSPYPEVIRNFPENLRARVINFEELSLQNQAKTFEELQQQSPHPEQILYSASLTRKAHDPRYAQMGEDMSFIDPTIYNIQKGHVVEVHYEKPTKPGTVSRAQAGFLAKTLKDAKNPGSDIEVGVLITSHPDIKRLALQPGSYLLKESPQGEKTNLAHIHGIAGLLRLMRENPDHPGILLGIDAFEDAAAALTSPLYMIEQTHGLVTQVPGGSNRGVLKLADGQEIEMNTVRMIHIVGIDKATLLERSPDEIYKGKPVRIWYEGRWHEGVVHEPDVAHGLIGVRTNEKLADNEYLDGHGFTVGKASESLDLRDPAMTSPREHPLAAYPHIKRSVAVAFDWEGQRHLGVVDRISVEDRFFTVDSSEGTFKHDFDEPGVEFLPPTEQSAPKPEVRNGNRISVFDFEGHATRNVYEIVGYDTVTQRILGRLLSFPSRNDPRPPWIPQYWYFDVKDDRYQILGNGKAELSRFPKNRFHLKVRFRWQEQILEGEVINFETLPVFLQIRDPDTNERFDVPLEDFIEEIKK